MTTGGSVSVSCSVVVCSNQLIATVVGAGQTGSLMNVSFILVSTCVEIIWAVSHVILRFGLPRTSLSITFLRLQLAFCE